MKHKGKAPAIYASAKRAYLVQPGQTIPRNARFVISHADLTSLAWAFDKSTNGNFDGTRCPSNGGMRTYFGNAEAVLQRVVNVRIEPVSLVEFQILRHALGSSHSSENSPDLGWRNSFNIDELTGEIMALLNRGLMECFKPSYYRVTERGKVLAGAPEGVAE